MIQDNKKRVVVAMSGGVDSSVAALLLKEKGYEVIGVYMRNWSKSQEENDYCPWADDQRDVRKVCDKLKIPCYTFNFEKEYENKVLEYFFHEYKAGRTPNPDVMCNKEIKFDVFAKKARELGADYIATGHYARVVRDSQGVHLLKGFDKDKDQSYFLWLLGQENLQNVLFPIGDLTKKQVREIARAYDLSTADKKDSQGICFVGPIKVREFLKTRIDMKPGEAVLLNGEKVAEHEGIWFYTIGQKLGANSVKWPSANVPALFVKDKVLESNKLIVGTEDELYEESLICDNMHWVIKEPLLPMDGKVSIRYRHVPQEARIEKMDNGRQLKIIFKSPQRAIAPGQSAVIYVGDEIIGGGIIVKMEDYGIAVKKQS